MMYSVVDILYLEELLVDFRELVGEHSGENLAHAVYETLDLYDLKSRVSIYLNLDFLSH